MPGHRVERLDLAAVPGGRAGVDQHARTPASSAARSTSTTGMAPGRTVTVPGLSAGSGPRAVGRSAPAIQAAKPPSSTRTSTSPDQRSSHQARAAASPLPPS